jgi:hypothetical protein
LHGISHPALMLLIDGLPQHEQEDERTNVKHYKDINEFLQERKGIDGDS